nr:hypothetical protein [Morchella crassipes]
MQGGGMGGGKEGADSVLVCLRQTRDASPPTEGTVKAVRQPPRLWILFLLALAGEAEKKPSRRGGQPASSSFSLNFLPPHCIPPPSQQRPLLASPPLRGGRIAPPSGAAFLHAVRAAPPRAARGGAIPPPSLFSPPPHCQLLAVVGSGKGGWGLRCRVEKRDAATPPPHRPLERLFLKFFKKKWEGKGGPGEERGGSCRQLYGYPPPTTSLPSSPASPPPNWLRQWGGCIPPLALQGGTLRPPPHVRVAPPHHEPPMNPPLPHPPPLIIDERVSREGGGFIRGGYVVGNRWGEGGCFSRAARADALAEPMKEGGSVPPPTPPPLPPPSLSTVLCV